MTDPGTTSPTSAAFEADPLEVRFFELSGTDAADALAPLADAWRGAGADVELLAAIDQDDLWLLVARGGGEPAAPRVPTGTRVWRFRSVAR
jgi:hypothetical protein